MSCSRPHNTATLDSESEVLTARPPHPHPVVEKEKLPFYFDFFNIPLASGGLAPPRPSLRLSYILCILAEIVSISTLLC